MEIINVLDEQFTNFASYVIVNNLPSIDGLLPVHRKALWALHKNGVSSNKPFIKLHRAGAYTMVYYIMGDIPLFGAMKNMANNGLNNMYLSPKGSFGDKRKKFDDGASARYVECRLSPYSEDCLLKTINKEVVPMKQNFDYTELEPIVMPSMGVNILTNTSQSVAVGMASKIPAHNLIETHDSIINYIKTKDIESSIKIIKCPDFEGTKGRIIYDESTFEKIYTTGRGSFSIVGNYKFNEKTNVFSIIEVPYETYIEDIEDKLSKEYEKGMFKEITYVHNSSGIQGVQLDITLKKNTDIKAFEQKLRKLTPYESKLSCNFTVLDLDGKTPREMSLKDIYDTWIQHRVNCIKNETQFDISKNNEELNKLYGLKIINEDLDKAIQIIRSSKTEKIAVENLVNEFNLNQKQSEYISTIRLVNINQDWITNKIKNINEIESENKQLDVYFNSEDMIKETIISQLEDIKKKYGRPRQTEIILPEEDIKTVEADLVEDYNPTIVLTNKYIKKTRKYSDNQKVTEDDEVIQTLQCNHKDDIILVTDMGRCLTRKVYEIDECLPSAHGTFIKTWLGDNLNQDEKIIYICTTKDYSGSICVCYENGKCAKIKLSKYKPKNNRKQAIDAYSIDNKLVGIGIIDKDDIDILLISEEGKASIIESSRIEAKSSTDQVGRCCIDLSEGYNVIKAIVNPSKDLNFTMTTEKGKEKIYYLDDIAETSQTEKSWYNHLRGAGSLKRTGNFIYNCRAKNDKIIDIVVNK